MSRNFAWFFSLVSVFVFVTTIAWAWNNPTGNPPAGGGTISTDVDLVTYFASSSVVNGKGTFRSAATTGQVLNLLGADRYWAIGQGGTQFPANGIGFRDLSRNATVLTIDGDGLISVGGNKVVNLGTPTVGTDAANKAYVDSQTGGAGSSKIWGEGRPGATVINVAGECPSTGIPTVKISRSSRPAHWDGSASACPMGWWVCSGADRDINGATGGYGACGSGGRNVVECDTRSGFSDDLFPNTVNWGWVSNVGSVNNAQYGLLVTATGVGADDDICALLPVWCCAYQ